MSSKTGGRRPKNPPCSKSRCVKCGIETRTREGNKHSHLCIQCSYR